MESCFWEDESSRIKGFRDFYFPKNLAFWKKILFMGILVFWEKNGFWDFLELFDESEYIAPMMNQVFDHSATLRKGQPRAKSYK